MGSGGRSLVAGGAGRIKAFLSRPGMLWFLVLFLFNGGTAVAMYFHDGGGGDCQWPGLACGT